MGPCELRRGVRGSAWWIRCDCVAAGDTKPGIFSHPPRNALSRLVVETQALAFRLLGKQFRPFAHPPSAMVAVLREAGLHLTFRHPVTVWQITALATLAPVR